MSSNLIRDLKRQYTLGPSLSEVACGTRVQQWERRCDLLARQRRRLQKARRVIDAEIERIDARLNIAGTTLDALRRG